MMGMVRGWSWDSYVKIGFFRPGCPRQEHNFTLRWYGYEDMNDDIIFFLVS